MKLQLKSRYLEILIAVAFVVLLVYVVSVTLQVARGISQTIEPPTHVIRLQVLNGCGVPKLAAQMADKLSGYTDRDVRISVVDTDNFDLVAVDSTFVISRDRDMTAAVVLARKLGLDDSQVTYDKLDNNYRHVSVTLVVGADHDRLTIPQPAMTEKQ
ncbi:LytR C-terminal domain-containing protein [bacterium]|nr:LytR C-terminal domain-containing protein [bacterium]